MRSQDRPPSRQLQVLATSTGRHEYEVIEDAVRGYLHTPAAQAGGAALRQLLGRLGEHADLDDVAALDLAYGELHATRREHPHP